MNKEIIINVSSIETRIAITEDGVLTELFVEHEENVRSIGDIYLGKIAKVLPGIKAAFINVGHKQDAFLHFSDVGEKLEEYNSLIGDDSDVDTLEDEDEEKIPSLSEERKPVLETPQIPRLEKGKDIIVQVIKEPVGNKGFRVTSRVSLPGRYLVLLPFDNKVGVSKKIVDARIRRRLRKLVRPLLPQNFGTIIRTNAETADEKAIADDLKSLLNTWQEVEQSVKTEKAPALIYKDMSTLSSVIRDLFNQDVSKIIIDNKKLFKQIKNYLQIVHPQFASRVELYKGSEPIFDVFGLEKQIETALSRKVFLPSGGYIVIDNTEAMIVIDVNSGRYAASMQQELNSLKTDLEAAREAVRQIRLRDIGGIIVIDFIDLEDEKNRKKVYDELKKEFKKDKAKTTILPMTEFGLVQITRQRIRKNVFQISREKCTFCNGTGLTISRQHVSNSIERWIRRFKAGKFLPYVILKVSPVVYDYLKKGIISRKTKLMFRYKLFIKLVIDDSLKADEFKFFSPKTKKELTLDYQ